MSTPNIGNLMKSYFDAKTDLQREKALKEIEKHGGIQAVILVEYTNMTVSNDFNKGEKK